MYANLPLRSHAFVAIAALGAAATVGLTTAEAAPMSIFMSRPNVGVARAGPAFVPRPARPMLGSPFVARPAGSLLGNRASNRFSPVTQASLNTTNRSSGSVNLQRRATPIAQVDRSVLTNGNNGKNSSVNLQRRATPIAQVDRGALINGNNGKNGSINSQRSGTPIAQVNRGAIPLVDRIPGRTAVVPGVTRLQVSSPMGRRLPQGRLRPRNRKTKPGAKPRSNRLCSICCAPLSRVRGRPIRGRAVRVVDKAKLIRGRAGRVRHRARPMGAKSVRVASRGRRFPKKLTPR